MAKLINKYDWKTGAELGVKEGLFTQYLLHHTKIEKMYCIDHWQGSDDLYTRFYDLYKDSERVEIIRKPTLQAVKDIPVVDFVFIDADHSYEAVKNDINAYLPKTRYFLCGHDYGNRKVKKAVDEKFELCKKGQDECWGVYIDG